MFPVEVRGIKIGEETPKVCVPIVGSTEQDILEQATTIQALPVEIVEWRADWFEKINDVFEVKRIVLKLREILGDKVILFTYRTIDEGGNGTLEPAEYKKLYMQVSEIEDIDMIDLELFHGEEIIYDIIEKAKNYNKKIVISNHDFEKTPSNEELIQRVDKMQEMKADIAKIAVMPNTKRDVLRLMDTTQEIHNRGVNCPIVSISMGELGVLSRISAEFYGSAITFGSVGKKSAPGQLDAEELIHMLRMIHENLQISNK